MTTSTTHFTFIGWAVILLLLFALNKTKVGHTLIYWGLVLILMFLFLNNYQRIQAVMIKGGSTQ